ncbi:hypothetical protein C8J57DRAFT_1230817 [Mycena rebaudengoi]|nr:hypothetical protein C8J57DRAFT_1230817 [Mycena rebaudengoi]
MENETYLDGCVKGRKAHKEDMPDDLHRGCASLCGARWGSAGGGRPRRRENVAIWYGRRVAACGVIHDIACDSPSPCRRHSHGCRAELHKEIGESGGGGEWLDGSVSSPPAFVAGGIILGRSSHFTVKVSFVLTADVYFGVCPCCGTGQFLRAEGGAAADVVLTSRGGDRYLRVPVRLRRPAGVSLIVWRLRAPFPVAWEIRPW